MSLASQKYHEQEECKLAELLTNICSVRNSSGNFYVRLCCLFSCGSGFTLFVYDDRWHQVDSSVQKMSNCVRRYLVVFGREKLQYDIRVDLVKTHAIARLKNCHMYVWQRAEATDGNMMKRPSVIMDETVVVCSQLATTKTLLQLSSCSWVASSPWQRLLRECQL